MIEPRRPGRPRSAEADTAVLRATLELLAEEGLQGLSVERVAVRAGVAKTTLYRRFPTKQRLVAAALETLALRAPSDLATGSARGDYLELARRRVEEAPGNHWNLLMPRLVVESASDPKLHTLVRRILVDPERAIIGDILQRGVDRGELAADLDLDLATDILIGPIAYRILIDRGDLLSIAGLPERLFDLARTATQSDAAPGGG